MPEWAIYAVAAMAGYLAGSIPFGLVLVKAAGLGDIREIGSKSIGATNVLRTGRKDLALATVLLDSLKAGLVALAFTLIAGREAGMVAGAAAFLGHCYPIWLKFKGGKGVATYAGLLLFITPLHGLVVGAPVWLGMFALTRISSLSALTAAVAVPPGAYLLGERSPVILGGLAALSVLVFWTHRANIGRLLNGTEPRFGAKKKDAAEG
ncbi:glycerol-3-phosphate acyltransferase [Hyphomonas sp. CACIAM 19H1]|uniref:glycerol-3-phosphate 1-O-acyltransferase PlsY n=1 Tax=Hyphomonas sp. CACIAM 19H1 TaxID=1873716 RepID=UPI000DEDCA4F|nr:glycerol-3-phosphate 1-O-acyltransferase PlsY [Hyphomonas sp. CACIAM 19H1]AXE64874.1 glycerol-3-phosphate acyltransferase [Hyphomonas sp. CACIAM 19H1]